MEIQAKATETRKELSAAGVAKLLAEARRKPPLKRKAHADGKVDGLQLRITPSGNASWSVEYTRPGIKREGGPKPGLSRARYTLGDADGPEALSLAQAREKALDIRAKARDGEDPHFDAKT